MRVLVCESESELGLWEYCFARVGDCDSDSERGMDSLLYMFWLKHR